MKSLKYIRVEVDLQDILFRIFLLVICLIVGILIQVFSSWAFDGDWFGVNGIVYKHGVIEKGVEVKIYYLGEMLFYLGQNLGQLIWVIGMREVVNIFKVGRSASTFGIDLILVCIWYVLFTNDKLHHTSQTNLVILSIAIFGTMLLVHLLLPKFRKLKLY